MRSTPFSKFFGLAAFGAAMLISGIASAQDTSSVNPAVQVAQKAVGTALQNKVVSVYGLGTPAEIQKWYIIFYEPSVPSHGRAVLVQNGQIVKTYDAQGGVTYAARLTFDPSRITAEQPALNAAQNYASKHNIAYDSVRALLKETSAAKPLRWRIQLMDAGKNCGYVLINPADDAVVAYLSPSSSSPSASSGGGGNGTGSVGADAENFGNDVKNTFLGIGGDLQQFFTGERTVDR